MIEIQQRKDWVSVGAVLTELFGDPRNLDYSSLKIIRSDPFRGQYTGRWSDYEAGKAKIHNEKQAHSPAEYEQRIHALVTSQRV